MSPALSKTALFQTGIAESGRRRYADGSQGSAVQRIGFDGVIPLIEAGVITGARKNFKPRKIILGFALGTKRLFEFVDNNPIFEFHPTAYTNDPALIARNDKMVAINSALQIDLTGQVCSDSIGNQFYSGIGGQVDFLRGASRSKGGKPIIAISSTAKHGTISRIVPMLYPGAGVVTSRGLVRYVVTEYGVAFLHGKSIRERAKSLIEIAHPDFRNECTSIAKRRSGCRILMRRRPQLLDREMRWQ
jgi:acyl-CoA hydrolase